MHRYDGPYDFIPIWGAAMNAPMSSEYGISGLPEHMRGFALMHVAMRRDARRLVAASATLRPSAYAEVGVWWRQLRDIIDWHHRSEDDILWPELRVRVPGFAANEHALNVDHSVLDQSMAAVSAVLVPGGAPSALVPAVNRFDTLINEHLSHEEAVVFPIFANSLTISEFLTVERRVVESAPLKIMTFLQPWMFDGVDKRSVAHVAASIPPPVRLLGNTMLRWRYERTLAPVMSAARHQ